MPRKKTGSKSDTGAAVKSITYAQSGKTSPPQT